MIIIPAKNTTIVVKNNIPKIIKGLSGKQVEALGDTIGGMLKIALSDRIQGGDSSWAPLSQSWAEEKGHDRPWYFTGILGGSIDWEVKDGKVYAGLIDAGSYRDGENIATVAHKLEYGKGKIPARPLFRPVAEESEDEIKKEALEYVKDLIKKGKI